MNPHHGLVALASALLLSTGCSILCSTSSIAQPCDQSGDCLPGYICSATNLCEKANTQDSGPSGCSPGTQDTDCPYGACVNDLCDNGLLSWANGENSAPNLGCYSSYPPGLGTDDAGIPELAGCIVTLPGDSFSGEPSLFLTIGSANQGQAIVTAAPSCGAGAYSYYFSQFADGGGPGVLAPINQLFELDTYTDAGALPTRTYPIYISPAAGNSPQRNAFSISPKMVTTLLGEMGVTIAADGGLLGNGYLVLGVVNDCTPNFSGDQMSGVQVVVQNSEQRVFYLNANGVPIAGRHATDPSGMFASYVAPGNMSGFVSVSYFQGSADGGQLGFGPENSVVALDLTGSGVIWVPLSPSGP